MGSNTQEKHYRFPTLTVCQDYAHGCDVSRNFYANTTYAFVNDSNGFVTDETYPDIARQNEVSHIWYMSSRINTK